MAGMTNRAQMGPCNPSLQCSRQPLPRKQNPLMRWDQPVIPQIPWPCHAFLPSKSSCVQWAWPLLCTLARRRRYERVGAGPRQGPVESRAGATVPLGPPSTATRFPLSPGAVLPTRLLAQSLAGASFPRVPRSEQTPGAVGWRRGLQNPPPPETCGPAATEDPQTP